jgi:enediyne biosynthesis protein E4
MAQIPRVLAILILLTLYAFTRPADIDQKERVALSKDFKFEKSVLYYPKGVEQKFVREVHPQYQRFCTWISSIGAAVTFTDFDGDRLVNDLVHVDPRFDKVMVTPAPGTGKRFEPIELSVNQLPYNAKTMAPTGTLAQDFNEDGQMDVLVYYLGRSPVIFYRQGEASFVQAELSPKAQTWNSSTGTIADFDGNGHADIFIGNYFPDETKLLDKDATDTDQIMQHSMSRGDNGGQNRIFLWAGIQKGKAVFKESKDWFKNLHYPKDWTLAVAAADINGDLLPELYVANDFGPDKLLLNNSAPGKLSFTELKSKRKFNTIRSNVVGNDSFKGMGVDFGDINGDGLLDIFVSNIAADYALHESHFAFINTGKYEALKAGVAPFVNESEKLGLSRSSWAWEAKLTDFNNDGVVEAIQATGFVKGKTNRWPELQELATGNDELLAHPRAWPQLQPGDDLSGDAHIPLFVRHKSGKYYDLAANLGLDNAQITRGIAISDMDHDGKLDFVSANQWENSNLYHNKSNSGNSFVGLSLLYPLPANKVSDIEVDVAMPGRYAIGAVAKLQLANGKQMVAFVDGGNGHTGKNSSEVHFGLGKVDPRQDLKIELTWRKSDGAVASSVIKVKPGWHTVHLPY